MVSENLFRGKRLDNGEWAVGHFYTQVYHPGTIEEDWYCFIKPIGSETWEKFRVDPNTVSQYAKFTDKNDKKVFEGDIVNVYDRFAYAYENAAPRSVAVVLDRWSLSVKGRGVWRPQDTVILEVIGNVFDNPELAGGEWNWRW